MSDYKTTLNLPVTDFAMRASLPIREPEFLKKWQTANLYQQIRDKRAGQKQFILHDGPPYANGHPHCGHALNKILKDIIVKSKTMSGYDAPYVPGWDCHGLPIELNVEKKLGRAGDKVSVDVFREACRDYAKSQIAIQAEDFQRLGVLGDWENPYTTMRYDYEASVVRALGKIIEEGHLQAGFKPVHWCIACGSALAEAEVEYEDKTSPAIDVAFELVDNSLLATYGDFKQVILPIWTTTPWTLPANEAVCLHPRFDYSLVKVEQTLYVVAKDLVENFCKRLGFSDYTVIGQEVGALFENQRLKHPWLDKTVPVVLGEHVTTDTGTGCVHTAPSHGTDDYIVGLQYGLPIENLLKSNSCFIDSLEHIGGLSVWKANPIIIDLLKNSNHLLSHSEFNHSYPHCWRHKTPLIFMATPQWFVMMDSNGLRQKLLDEVDKVEWLPQWGENRMRLMISQRPDWCLSRQRAWGTPMTLFVHKETKQLHPNTLALIEQVACLIEKEGLSAWFNLDAKVLIGDDALHYDKLNDTLDVWFDSGVSHYAVLAKGHDGLSFPADLYLEGSDQYRGWFNSSLTTSVAMGLKSPYKAVLIHGFTVDGEGKKLSKSKGNYVELKTLIAQNGADIIRLWVSSTDYRYEVSISPEILQRTGDAYRRIRNTARFLLSNLFDYHHERDAVESDTMMELDSYILQKAHDLQKEVVSAYEDYQFHLVYQKIHHFCAMDLGGFYLDIIKDRQYTLPKQSIARRSCQTAMYHILQALVRMLAPIISYTAEEIWQHMPGWANDSVFLQTWYDNWPILAPIHSERWHQLQDLRDEVNKALEVQRQAGVIGSGLAASVHLFVHDKDMLWLNPMAEELKFFFMTSECILKPYEKITGAHVKACENFDIIIAVQPMDAQKCDRCWHRHPSVGQSTDHPLLCLRCESNILGQDEHRVFV
jgi:isoleucyl-tRNA synthetase